ncbi:MAG: hypothetical protein M3461_16560 [Pseudomonadota bacterium]|nr:hypothetical protein [Pseudomonadota bacterium]
MHGAFCFPIAAAGGLIGVMEFLSAEVVEPDAALLAVMDAIGTQIGQFVEGRGGLRLALAEELDAEGRAAASRRWGCRSHPPP